MKTQIYIVDNNTIVRNTLARLINHESDLRVCGQSQNGRKAFEEISRLRPQVAIVDLSLDDMSGIDLIKELNRLAEPPAILIVSMLEKEVFLSEALKAGAKGFIMKTQAADCIVGEIRKVSGLR